MRAFRTVASVTVAVTLVAACALIGDIQDVTVVDEGDAFGPTRRPLPDGESDDAGPVYVAFDAQPIDAPADVTVDAPPSTPYVDTWSTSPFEACSSACGGTQCRSVSPKTYKATPPNNPPPYECQSCSPPCCDCPDLGSNWFYNNGQGSADCNAACSDGCIVKYASAILEQQAKGCVLRQTTCLKGFGCP